MFFTTNKEAGNSPNTKKVTHLDKFNTNPVFRTYLYAFKRLNVKVKSY